MFWLFGIELIRQIHYLISEHSAAYHQFFTKKVFGGVNRRTSKINAWNRYRMARAAKWLLVLVLGAIILGRALDASPFTAYFEGLSRAVDAVPVIAQAAIFLLFWIGFQFLLMGYFMTRGGVETFFPDDISTRFSDVWGQDQVKHKIRENLMFLDNPERIEEKGGYVPGGILLWGPPGTGKTLMAEAMAGETGMPFVNVDAVDARHRDRPAQGHPLVPQAPEVRARSTAGSSRSSTRPTRSATAGSWRGSPARACR